MERKRKFTRNKPSNYPESLSRTLVSSVMKEVFNYGIEKTGKTFSELHRTIILSSPVYQELLQDRVNQELINKIK